MLRYLRSFPVVSFLFILSSTLFDVVVWGMLDYHLHFLNPVTYAMLFTLGWTFIPLVVSQKLNDYRIAFVCICYYLFNIEDLFFYLILIHAIPPTFVGIYALGIPNPTDIYVFIWETIGVVVMAGLILLCRALPVKHEVRFNFILASFICALSIYLGDHIALIIIPDSAHSIYFQLFFVAWTVIPKLLSWRLSDSRVGILTSSYFIFRHFLLSYSISFTLVAIILVILILAGKEYRFLRVRRRFVKDTSEIAGSEVLKPD